MRSRTPLLIAILAVIIIGGGFLAYDYVKEQPPPWLIKLLTRTDTAPPLPAGDIAPLTVPEGFVATIYARDIKGARVIARDPKGTLLVSLTSQGKVVALPDLSNDQKSDETITVLEGLKQPHGILVHCSDTGSGCVLYVAETGELKAYAYDADTYTATYRETLATFPTGSGHFTRTLLMHPDGKRLLASVGSSCNVCIESDERRATVMAIDLVTKQASVFATGLRNTVFMDLDPVTGEVWGTDNGRDIIGDDIPPDEVNIIRQGNNYGWPYCYADRVYDTDFNESSPNACIVSTPPHIALQAHSAPLGLAFVPEEGWPEDMRSDLLVAYHGSWNRSEPTGYKVVRINLGDDRNPQGTSVDFVTGFLAPSAPEDEAIGRPVDLLAEPGGTVYVSDDRAGAIYRISRVSLD